ncbi:DUF3048 domain-containing protein [Actinomadura craniellae]|uniref:DUF3048 domain-containing protein n=1 Tax=Actinomadura craniellae TaxID=2231787 RepID=A0A365HDM3_9ACTN|nr:DUF3048 domain-containing protein [Actinomadura craniellae]RAY17205.1 DUF3048 domain-containing protein [Actinomadura craniellae]
MLRTAAILGAVTLAGVSACSEDGRKAVPPVSPGTTTPTPTPTPTPPATHPFTGGRTGLQNPVLAVKIDNTRPAHPQEGLRSADIIYVEQVEGGETRLMAIFSSKLPRRVGPVRSARISDLHILSAYGRPAFAFSGVQSKMKPYIRRSKLYDISQDNGGSSYFRVGGGRSIPYNLFSSPRALLAQAPKASGPRNIGFRFGPAPEGGKPRTSFTARWPSETMGFRWSAAQKRWLSSHSGRSNTAAEGGVLGGQTIVVQYAKTTRSRFHDFLGSYTPLIHTTGTGRATVLRDGKAYDARWSRPNEESGTTFTTAAGAPMTFAPGQVWVVLVNDGPPRIP